LCGRAFLRPTPADPNERPPARAMLRQTPILPIRSRCARAAWRWNWQFRLLGYRHDREMGPRGLFGRLGGHLGRGRCRLDLRRSVGAKRPEDSRNPAFDPSDQFGKRLLFVARRSSSSSHWALPISSKSSRSCRLTRSFLCGVGWATMTDYSCSIAVSNCSVSAFRFRRAYSAGKVRPRSLPESVWLRKPGSRPRPAHQTARSLARWFRPAWAIPTQPFINHAD
jgi:hypothetical protein